MKTKSDISIEIFGRETGFSYQPQGIIDVFKSCSVTWNAYSYNTFHLISPLDSPYLTYLISDNILEIKGCYFYIDSVVYEQKQSPFLVIRGKSLYGKATKRIVYSTYSTSSNKPEKIMFDLINKNLIASTSDRQIKYLTIATPSDLGSKSLSYQNSYGVVEEEVTSLAESNQICIRETPISLENPVSQIEFFKGRDLSGEGGVELSISEEGIYTESYTRDVSDMANVAYVFGEGEGNARKMVIAINQSTGKPDGLDVNEIYVDARDLQQKYTDESGKEITLTDAEYKEKLLQRGYQKLDEHPEIIQLSGEVNTDNLNFAYGKDYEVGDTIKQTSERFGISKSSVLTSMTETWDETGYHLDPTFDKDRVSVIQKIKGK